jgi:hypothetical protein
MDVFIGMMEITFVIASRANYKNIISSNSAFYFVKNIDKI